jgi:small redox-active disulfide protein 2
MKIEVLGAGCYKCKILYDNTRQAIEEAGIDCTLEKVEDIKKFAEYGVMYTPALVIDGEVKVSGKILTPDQIKNLLT